MIEGIVAVVGAVIGLFIYRIFGQKITDAGQRALEDKVKEIEKKDSELAGKDKEITAKETQKIEEITNEQNKKLSLSGLVDFFRNNKSGR